MAGRVQESELLQRILADSMAAEEETLAVEDIRQKNPQVALSLLPVYLKQKHYYKAAWADLKKASDEMVKKLQEPPLYPATFLHFLPGATERAFVAAGSRRLVVTLSPEINPTALKRGKAVFLNHDMNILLQIAPELSRTGLVAVFSRYHDGRAVLKGAADEEFVMDVAEELSEELEEGDLVLYDRESLVAYERVENGGEKPYPLEEVPDVSFDDIGGLDDVIEEIRQEVTLHLFHRDLVERHRLKNTKGIILYGPPGVGKTMLAKALTNHLRRLQGGEASFFNIKPGAHRSMWYGKTEENIRELFSLARNAANGDGRIAVMFFDDIDQLGARGDSISTAVDTRVLPSFLHEIDGLEELNRILLIGSTNRPDLLDEALLRPGRFGDKVFRIPRPNREAAREIFRKHLVPDLPYCTNGREGESVEAQLIEAALSIIYTPNGGSFNLATLTFRDGSRRTMTAPEVMSGALIANAVTEAKRRSCLRALRGGFVGITKLDLLSAIDREMDNIVSRLRPGPGLQQMLDLPQDLDVVKVEVHPSRKLPRSYESIALQ